MRGRKTGVRAVATYTFPAEIFLIEGDPEAVRESGRSYGRFAGIAAEAAAGLRGLDSGTWVGTEGDLFRAQVAGISPHPGHRLRRLRAGRRRARRLCGSARRRPAPDGRGARRRRTDLRIADRGPRRAGRTPGADRRRGRRRPARRGRLPGAPRRAALGGRIGRLEAAWEAELAAASGLRLGVLEAARHSASVIRAAGRTSPTAGQN
jgi:hypothetical protein